NPPMKTSIKELIHLVVLFPRLSLVLPGPVTAQTFKVIQTYSDTEGQYPWSGVILSGNTLYGTAVGGGSHDSGTVFALNTDGSGFTDLYSLLRSVGASPFAGLLLSDSTL
ncbi:MAG: hypothetical protein NT154_01475, partial [Verrucomicrobia bacterium]|nr:hypothetical protein [Verrucomicrobiota bacterium]